MFGVSSSHGTRKPESSNGAGTPNQIPGNRVLKRSTNGGGSTTLSVYALGLEEYDYSGSGTLSGQIHYYTLAGHLLGESNGSSTVYNLTDALGSILSSISSSAILGQQVSVKAARTLATVAATSKGARR